MVNDLYALATHEGLWLRAAHGKVCMDHCLLWIGSQSLTQQEIDGQLCIFKAIQDLIWCIPAQHADMIAELTLEPSPFPAWR